MLVTTSGRAAVPRGIEWTILRRLACRFATGSVPADRFMVFQFCFLFFFFDVVEKVTFFFIPGISFF
jgi:hypothetical protein